MVTVASFLFEKIWTPHAKTTHNTPGVTFGVVVPGIQATNTLKLKHFLGFKIPTTPQPKKIGILIEQTNEELLTVFEERGDLNASEPN